jgi:small subunit ribosomal protein S1
VLENYNEEDVVEGRVTKVVTFGAFVEILPGVEGLVHISELAQHHVENPREVVSQGDAVNVLILEVDAERRRLSLSLKRVEEGSEPLPRADGAESVHLTPKLDLSEDVFPAGAPEPEAADASLPDVDLPPAEAEGIAAIEGELESAAEAPVAETPVEEAPVEDAPVDEPPVDEAPAAEAAELEAEEPAADAVEPTDEPAPQSDAAAELELESESTADADGAAGDDAADQTA